MNKSLLTNIIAAIFIAVGYLIPDLSAYFLSIGYFALSGAITNWLAVYMLFERVPLLYGSGVIPNHFQEFKSGIKNLIMTEFFTEENLNSFFKKSTASIMPAGKLDKAIETVDFDIVFNNLTQVIMASKIGAMLGMFGGAEALEAYRPAFIEKIKTFILTETTKPEFLAALSESGSNSSISADVKSQVEKIVEIRLEELTPQMVKEIIQVMIRKHLGWLVVWGGVFGGLIGLVMSILKIR